MLFLHFRGHVGVCIQRERSVCVSQDAGQGFRIHAAGQGMRCEGMPQIVETNGRQFCIPKQGFHTAVGRFRRQWKLRHRRIMEDPFAVGFPFPCFQDLYCAGRKLDSSRTFFSFRFTNFHTATFPAGDRTANLQPPSLFIKVLPLEAADLTPAHAGGQLRVEEVRPNIILPHHIQKLLELGFCQNILGCVVRFGNHRTIGRVFHDDPLLNCCVHRLVEHHVDAPN